MIPSPKLDMVRWRGHYEVLGKNQAVRMMISERDPCRRDRLVMPRSRWRQGIQFLVKLFHVHFASRIE